MVKLLTSGLYTSIQDGGRFGHRSLGIPLSGAMDRSAMRLANSLVENTKNMAVIECTLQGPSMVFDAAAIIAVTGAKFAPKLNGENVGMYSSFSVNKGDVLSLGTASTGVFGYVAVGGGWDVSKVLGSASQYKGISPSTRLLKNDEVPIGKCKEKQTQTSNYAVNTSRLTKTLLDVYPGPEFKMLTPKQQSQMATTKFIIGKNSNRMAYGLEHKGDFMASEIITAPVQPGTIQLTPSGEFIVLMRDAQTTGGYARILQLTDLAVDILSQKRAEQAITFNILSF